MTAHELDGIRIIDSGVQTKPLPIVIGGGSAHAVLWPGNGAKYRTFNLLDLQAKDRTLDLTHACECVYYVAAGDGRVRTLATDEAQELVEGSMIHIGVGDAYRIEAGEKGIRLVGGTVPADEALYEIGGKATAS